MTSKIAMVEDDAADYGLGRAWRALTLYLNSKYSVVYISVNELHHDLEGTIRYIHLNEKYDGDKTKNNLRRAAGSAPMLRKILKAEKPDVVISFGLYACARLAVATLGLPIKVVMAERGNPMRHSVKGRACVQFIYSFADRIIYQSEAGKRCASKANQRKSVVIPNALYRDNLPISDPMCGRREIVTSGRIHPDKRYDMLLRSFAAFQQGHTDYKLTVYGEEEKGETRGFLSQLRLQSKELGIDDHVVFAGYVEDVCGKMAGARAFVFTSAGEGMPNSIIEAMAIGIPCITTDYVPGGANEFIESGYNGIIVPVDNEKRLTEAMCLLADDDEKCKDLAENALQIRKTLSKKVIFAMWDSMLQAL